MAQRWLLYNDTLWADENAVVTPEMATQRYVLALLYFATNGQDWAENNWLQGHECSSSWIGVKCHTNDKVRAIAFGKFNLYMRVESSGSRLARQASF